MRKPNMRPRDCARYELDEQRLADADRFTRQQAVRHVTSSAQATSIIVNQTEHGFAVLDALRTSGGTWVKSQASTAIDSIVGGVVIAVLSPDVFVLGLGGFVSGLSGLTADKMYHLSADTAGLLTTTGTGIPVLYADTTTSGFLLPATRHRSPSHVLGAAVTAAGSGSVTVPEGVYRSLAIIVGAGGGGAGSSYYDRAVGFYSVTSGGAVSNQFRLTELGGGGGGGECLEVEFDVVPGENISYVVGAGGAGGTGSFGFGSTDGVSGSSSTITVGGTTWTALPGGGGGKAHNSIATGTGGRSISGTTANVRRRFFNRRSGENGESGLMLYELASLAISKRKGGLSAGGDGRGSGGLGGRETDGSAGDDGSVHIWF